MVSLHVVAMKTCDTLVDVSVCGLAAGSEHDVLDSSVRRWSAVYSSLMAVVVAPLAEPARADCTAKRSRSGVRKQVLMEPNSDLATEPTKVANVSVAMGVVMHSHVSIEIPWKAECTTADRAQIRLLARVNLFVGGQLGQERKCLIASAATMRSFWSCPVRDE